MNGWTLSQNREFAVLTDAQIYVDRLNPKEGSLTSQMVLSNRHGNHPSCAAFSPKGKILATGDGKAPVVTIYSLLANDSEKTNQSEGMELLRLQHEGPIVQIGFSPDGRVLAALGKREDTSSGPIGIIRLWITDNWDLK